MINHYFQSGSGIGTSSEQDLMQQLVNESIQAFGCNFTYIPRDLVNIDEIFHEDTLSIFTKNYTIEMYIENYANFLGDGSQMSKFGFQLGYQMRLMCSRERFFSVLGKVIPTEGDLIYYPTSNSLFEIKFIDDKNPLFPMGSRQYFTINCELFKYSNESFSTGTLADLAETNSVNDGNIISDPFAKNTDIETLADTVVDFAEVNPFGTP